jgi:hypothetical protein
MTRLSQLVVVFFTLSLSTQSTASKPFGQFASNGYEHQPAPNSGCVKGDCYNGYGTFQYANGNRYVGNFKDGNPDGQGILYCANGNKYLGHWDKNWRQGQGRYIFNEGHEYFGEFHRNQFHGKGVMRYANGDQYDGAWKHNLPNGFGVYTFRAGDRYEGLFEGGRFNGEGTMFYVNGSKFSGTWRNNKKHGSGIFYDAAGQMSAGDWINGQPKNMTGSTIRDEEAVLIESIEEEAPAKAVETAPANSNSYPESSVRIWAVVVGIATYQHMPSLRYTDDDAYQFYAFLKSPEGGALPDGQLKVLIDEVATRENILGALRNVLLNADENDVVMFYFSGHGVEGSFIPADFDGYNYRLYHDEIRSIFDQSKAKHKLVLADACHSGTLSVNEKSDLLAARAPVYQMLEKYYKAFENSTGGMALLMSSKGVEVSLEDTGLRSGVFSYFLIRGMKGEADINFDQIVTIEELFGYVRNKVSGYTAGAQTPILTGKFDKKMPAGVVRH